MMRPLVCVLSGIFAFNSVINTEMQAHPKSSTPGPGSYIDINNPVHSSVGKCLLKFATDRGLMMVQGIKNYPFGSTATRFPPHSKKHLPGPGTYDVKLDTSDEMITAYNKMMRPMTQATSYMFKSTSKRFSKVKEKMPPSTSMENASLKEIRNLKLPYYPMGDGKYGFCSSVARFVDRSEEPTPGPGFYNENKIERSAPTAKVKSIKRINATNEGQATIGPGCYNPVKEQKRSFNVSMDVRLDNI